MPYSGHTLLSCITIYVSCGLTLTPLPGTKKFKNFQTAFPSLICRVDSAYLQDHELFMETITALPVSGVTGLIQSHHSVGGSTCPTSAQDCCSNDVSMECLYHLWHNHQNPIKRPFGAYFVVQFSSLQLYLRDKDLGQISKEIIKERLPHSLPGDWEPSWGYAVYITITMTLSHFML